MKDLIRPPFATYDVVVYFGGGLFFIPFLLRYVVDPLGLKLPKVQLDVGSALANEVVSTLTLLFSIYIVGHLIAYFGSQLIEKAIDRFFGKISTAIILSSLVSANRRNELIRAMFYDRVSKARADGSMVSTVIRALFHFPLIIQYVLAFSLGVFGYYDTRISAETLAVVRAKFKAKVMANGQVGSKSKWFKPLEYYVINNMPGATTRMYNYLVIAGLFRSIAFIFIFSSWMMIYFLLHFWWDGDWLIPSVLNYNGFMSGVAEFLFVSSIATFCIFSYIKFQRRYAEEAIMAFAFTKELDAT